MAGKRKLAVFIMMATLMTCAFWGVIILCKDVDGTSMFSNYCLVMALSTATFMGGNAAEHLKNLKEGKKITQGEQG